MNNRIKIIVLTLLLCFCIGAGVHFFDSVKEGQQEFVFMEMVATLSPAKNIYKSCKLNHLSVDKCKQLNDFLKKSSKQDEDFYYFSDTRNIYGINFSKSLVLNFKYDEASLKWSCFGYPESALVTMCSPLNF